MNWRDAEREYTDEVIGETSLARAFDDAAQRHENRPAQRYKGGVYDRSLTGDAIPAAPDGEYHSIPYATMRDLVANVATGLREIGVAPGDRVGIFSHTRMEWAISDFAILSAGGVVTTIYPGSSEDQTRYLLDDPGADGVVVENQALLDRVVAVEDDLDLEFVVCVDEFDGYGDREDVYSLAEVHDLGEAAFDPETYDSWLDERDPEDLASLIYTSGTTGQPKGVQLTHWNFRSNVNQIRKRYGPRPDKPEEMTRIDENLRTVSYLPLAHVFERTAGHFVMFLSGASIAYAENPDTLREDFSLVGPNAATSVPRVYEKIYEAIREQAETSSTRERIFEWATEVGREYHETDDPGTGLRLRHRIADRLVFSSVRDALGGELEFLISGGGSLSPKLASLYHAMGLPILEGYGLTETAPVLTVNPPENPQIGTIGPPVVDVEYTLDEAVIEEIEPEHGGEVGELLVKGPNVFDGYWNQPDATESSFTEDGYFRTGDIVEVRPDEYFVFRERAKEILVLSTGKNVAPGPIEDSFASIQMVEQCMVIGDSEKFVAALIVPNFNAVRHWADEEGIDLPEDEWEVCRHEAVRDRIWDDVEAVNESFESYETIKKFRLVPEEWTEENEMLTPTMKKKRRNILAEYEDLVDKMYAEE